MEKPTEVIAALSKPANEITSRRSAEADRLVLRRPRPNDGPAVHDLIAATPSLDANSLYCNVLQCTHFADTCTVAEGDGAIVGWASGYLLPTDRDALFVWQVAVHGDQRGQRIGQRMIESILLRPECRHVTRLEATVTFDNAPSFAMFESLARRFGSSVHRSAGLDRETHFDGRHASEAAITIALSSSARRHEAP
jgi:L-2,4-diaminobutyric acid acetyltransferase